MEPKTKTRCTNKQITALVDYLSCHPLIAQGEFSGPLGKGRKNTEWATLAELLNEMGPSKSPDAWQRTWRELKKKARNENALYRRALGATGNTSIVPTVSEVTNKIIAIIGPASSEGIGPPESAVGTIEDVDVEQPPEDLHTRTATSSSSASAPQHRQTRARTTMSSVADFKGLQETGNQCLQEVVEELRTTNKIWEAQTNVLKEILVELRTLTTQGADGSRKVSNTSPEKRSSGGSILDLTVEAPTKSAMMPVKPAPTPVTLHPKQIHGSKLQIVKLKDGTMVLKGVKKTEHPTPGASSS